MVTLTKSIQLILTQGRFESYESLVSDAFNQDGAIYEATVKTDDGRVESYVGLARNFKKRWPKHKSTMSDRHADGQTTLSKYVWRKRDEA